MYSHLKHYKMLKTEETIRHLEAEKRQLVEKVRTMERMKPSSVPAIQPDAKSRCVRFISDTVLVSVVIFHFNIFFHILFIDLILWYLSWSYWLEGY